VVDVNAELTALEIELAALAGARVDFELRLDPAAGSARVDPFQLVDVLRQLVDNAREAMPEGGRLTITTAPADDAVEVAVADTGVGMDATTRARLFEPFFTTRSDQGAAGLGLAAVHGVVKQSGGDVVVDSAPGCGTTLTVRLPRVEGESVAPSGATEPALVRPTILLVEDEPLVRDVTAEALSDRGYEVLLAANGAEALELVSGRSEPIGLLVTDVIMPGINGRQLADRLRELQPGLRVLFVSGHADSAIFAAGSPAGVAFLQKPYAFDELGRKVAELLAG
jgi:CheY-like chemotaxis protein